jgi:Uma2 family endonuclease
MEYLIKTKSIGGMTEEQFFQFCQENDSIDFERNANGEIIIMAPTGTSTGWFNINISTDLTIWNRKSNLGYVFDSNTGFTLPNNAVRSPDAAFIRKEEWQKVSLSDRKRFAHVCPDFVIELLSEADHEISLQEKMKEWMENGCQLSWMINPLKKITIIYRRNGQAEAKSFDTILDGEDVLPGFTIDLSKIFTED